LWLVTVIGLCIGGGQIWLGIAATAIGVFALWCLKWVEARLAHQTRARLVVALGPETDPAELVGALEGDRLRIVARCVTIDPAAGSREVTFELLWVRKEAETAPPGVVERIAAKPGVRKLRWDELA
jgi:putative Mg2+ transporter-C (MgtC) family protein